MKTIKLFIFILFLITGAKASISFEDWFKNYDLGKPVVPNKILYMGISYDGKPNKLVNIFEILIKGNDNSETVSSDKRYVVFEGCKPRDCGNKGMLWIDSKAKLAVGVINHSFWEVVDFSKYKKYQIFIFSNFISDSKDLPKKFIEDCNKWLIKNKIKPSVIRFLNSSDKISIIEGIK
jgi:hypothetical protein